MMSPPKVDFDHPEDGASISPEEALQLPDRQTQVIRMATRWQHELCCSCLPVPVKGQKNF